MVEAKTKSGESQDVRSVKGSSLYNFVEEQQGEVPFGRVLDAGTGPRSLRWLLGLATESFTAVTGSPVQATRLRKLVADSLRPQDRVMAGNWADQDLLAGEQFDTVIADFLLGAIERFAPYFESRLFERLRPLTAKRLYVTGIQPYVIDRPKNEAGALIWEIGRHRDACLLLSGQRLHREYPLQWVLAELSRSGFKPIAARKFPVAYKGDFAPSQMELWRGGVERMTDRALAQSLLAYGEVLTQRELAHVEKHGALSHGFAYAVAADPA